MFSVRSAFIRGLEIGGKAPVRIQTMYDRPFGAESVELRPVHDDEVLRHVVLGDKKTVFDLGTIEGGEGTEVDDFTVHGPLLNGRIYFRPAHRTGIHAESVDEALFNRRHGHTGLHAAGRGQILHTGTGSKGIAAERRIKGHDELQTGLGGLAVEVLISAPS